MKQGTAARLAELGVKLPDAPSPVANYVAFLNVRNLVYISGQLPIDGKNLIVGKLGGGLDVLAGADAARLCAINMLSQAQSACNGDIERIERVIKICGYVNADPRFTSHPEVINGASDFFVQVFGERGRHVRSAVGVSSLPKGAAVELDGVFKVRD